MSPVSNSFLPSQLLSRTALTGTKVSFGRVSQVKHRGSNPTKQEIAGAVKEEGSLPWRANRKKGGSTGGLRVEGGSQRGSQVGSIARRWLYRTDIEHCEKMDSGEGSG